jgi:hypothetical protein
VDDQSAFKLSCELAQRINKEALAGPSSPYAGKFIGIVEGKVVVIADDPEAVHDRLVELSPNNRRCCWIEASRDYSKVEYV